ncbi:MAG: methyl-accepting chemotaxis protein [Planctomycetota bacterium]|jgi:methyl-accepting chemotaxis protein|nr:methyl-accepting chemotaxis protein [Planctomycetota bacterium]
MNSLTYKLSSIFLLVSLIPMVIGVSGSLSLQTAERALNNNNQAMEHLARLISIANDSLTENIRVQDNSRLATKQIALSQKIANSSFQDMRDTVLPRTFALGNIRYNILETIESMRSMFLLLTMRHLDTETVESWLKTQREKIQAALKNIQAASETYDQLLQDSDGRDEWEQLKANLGIWRQNQSEFMANMDKMAELNRDLIRGGPLFAAASRKAFDTTFVNGREIRLACELNIEALNKIITRQTENSVRRALQSQNRSQYLVTNLDNDYNAVAGKVSELRNQMDSAAAMAAAASIESAEAVAVTTRRFWYLAAFSIAGVAAALFFGVSLSIRISGPIRVMANQMTNLAKGDLSRNVSPASLAKKDEIGQLARALQDMINSNREEIKLADALANGDFTRAVPLRSESDQLGRAFQTMMRTESEMLSGVILAIHRVGKSAAAVTGASDSLSQGALTSAAALEEISQTVSNIDGQAKENASHASHANELATASSRAAKRGYDAVNELTAAIEDIRQSGKRIATVAKLIDDIAFQTNLLALNAAVEAARAGRHGKGFSVVADEVRSLSGRSAKAAKETEDMVESMTAKMEAGVSLASRTDQEFRDIVAATEQAANIIENITASSNKQSVALAQIATSLNQIDSVIQENTINAGQTAGSAKTLFNQAEDLRHSIAKFRLISDAAPLASDQDDPAAPANGGVRMISLGQSLPSPANPVSLFRVRKE